MSITISSPSWTTDPTILMSLFVLAGALGAWLIGRLADAVLPRTRESR